MEVIIVFKFIVLFDVGVVGVNDDVVIEKDVIR